MAAMGQPSGPPFGSVDYKGTLHAEIVNYFNKEGHADVVKAIKESGVQISSSAFKTMASRVNGVEDSMDADVKDDMSNGDAPNGKPGDSFLLDWWSSFWDLWNARGGGEMANGQMAQYLTQARMRQQHAQGMINPAMMQGQMGAYRGMMPNQMQPLDLQRKAMANNSRNLNPQFQQNRGMQQGQMGQTQMQREGSDVDMNGPRPQSPMSGENAPSPKRQRVDGGGMNGTMGTRAPSMGMQMPNGTAAGPAMLMQAGLDPHNLAQSQLGFAGPGGNPQQKYAQGIANSQRAQMEGVKNGGPPGMGQGSPIMSAGADGQVMPADFLQANAQMTRNMAGGNMTNSNGGALADYQMQLMLLEQQNKKRLMMARQEHDQNQRGDGSAYGGPQPGMPGQPGFIAPGMSPRNSRTGQSPNPTDQMKRGTPKMGGNSPLPDGSMPVTRGSPGPGFEGNMPPNAAFFPMGGKPGETMMAGQNGMMRAPPSSHPGYTPPNGMTAQQMEMMRQNDGRMPNWGPGQQIMPGQAMQQQRSQQQAAAQQQQAAQQQGQQGLAQNENAQRGNMPPPQAPSGGATNGRQNPSSPSQSGAPPTPQQTNKAAPKGKKEGKDTKKKNAKKNQATTGATPSSEAEAPQTPPPHPPITPVNPQSFGIGAKGQPNQNQAQPASTLSQAPQPNAAQPSAAVSAQPDGPDATAGAFGMDASKDMQMNMIGDFSSAFDNTDVLDGFDFDTFLQMGDDNANWDIESGYQLGGDGVETGAGDS